MIGGEPTGLIALTCDPPKQREAHGIENAGLPRSGGPTEQKESRGAECVEVDRDRLGERPEGRDVQLVQPHQTATSAS